MNEEKKITENADQKLEDDMTYGVWSENGHWHYPVPFDIEKVKDPAVQRLIAEEAQLPREKLEHRFRVLAKLTSTGHLQTSNLALIDHFMNGSDEDKFPFPDTEGTLTQKVFEHQSTLRFIRGINKKLGEALRDNENIPGSIDLSERLDGIPKPRFSSLDDYGKGLAFAVHILYDYSVVARNIVCDRETGKYMTTVDIELIDHFGMDYGDVDEFGTTKKVWKKMKPAIGVPGFTLLGLLIGLGSTAIYKFFNKPNADAKSYTHDYVDSAGIGAGSGCAAGIVAYTSAVPVAKQLAEGFRSWFILQHYFGCRPFITVMRKTFDIKGVIAKR
ncbi:MAG: hypothetical protein Pg6A_16460 [Termitinemataceae bacterium]|nr:MAG: hypothetical protein Pg6A_16460 [Termitinemataceae bacterium]